MTNCLVVDSPPAVLKILGSKPGSSSVRNPRILKKDFRQQILSSMSIACDIKEEGALN